MVSSSFLRHYDETKTLLKSQHQICAIGADGEQSSGLNNDAARYEREAAANDRYYASQPFQNAITKPFRLLDNAVYSSALTLARIVPGTLSTIANPKEAGIGAIKGLDSLFRNDGNLDGTQDASVVSRLRSSSARQITMGAAEKFTNLGLALSPLKARSGLVFGAELEFAAAIDLKRPYIRVDIRKAVEANTLRAKDGRFLDFNELTPIDAKYDLGHAYGHEFWRLKEYGQQQRMTQTQFNDYANNSKFYQIESPAFNRSHKYEKPR